jgi:hypothetical protein
MKKYGANGSVYPTKAKRVVLTTTTAGSAPIPVVDEAEAAEVQSGKVRRDKKGKSEPGETKQ